MCKAIKRHYCPIGRQSAANSGYVTLVFSPVPSAASRLFREGMSDRAELSSGALLVRRSVVRCGVPLGALPDPGGYASDGCEVCHLARPACVG
jgi:hypothetical protein